MAGESRAQRPSYLVELTFTEALILARAAFDAADSIKRHPLKKALAFPGGLCASQPTATLCRKDAREGLTR